MTRIQPRILAERLSLRHHQDIIRHLDDAQNPGRLSHLRHLSVCARTPTLPLPVDSGSSFLFCASCTSAATSTPLPPPPRSLSSRAALSNFITFYPLFYALYGFSWKLIKAPAPLPLFFLQITPRALLSCFPSVSLYFSLSVFAPTSFIPYPFLFCSYSSLLCFPLSLPCLSFSIFLISLPSLFLSVSFLSSVFLLPLPPLFSNVSNV